MKAVLDQQRVLELNSGYMASGVKSVREALSMMCAGAAVALVTDEGYWQTFKWEEWVTLPPRADELFISTSHAAVRVPKIIVAINYDKVTTKTMPLTLPNLLRKYGGRDCYTLEPLELKDASMEHVNPKMKGGQKTWDNILPAEKRRNNQRGHQTHAEFGMYPKMVPTAPRPIPVSQLIENRYEIPEWMPFLKR